MPERRIEIKNGRFRVYEEDRPGHYRLVEEGDSTFQGRQTMSDREIREMIERRHPRGIRKLERRP